MPRMPWDGCRCPLHATHPFPALALLHVFAPRPPAVFQEEEDASSRSYFNEVTAGVSDLEFTADGRYIVSRDYLTVKARGWKGGAGGPGVWWGGGEG